jgi:hypothetical protein
MDIQASLLFYSQSHHSVTIQLTQPQFQIQRLKFCNVNITLPAG